MKNNWFKDLLVQTNTNSIYFFYLYKLQTLQISCSHAEICFLDVTVKLDFRMFVFFDLKTNKGSIVLRTILPPSYKSNVRY